MENQNDQVLVTRKTFLTGGQKAGYLFAGLLGGAGCAILASLCNMDAPYRSYIGAECVTMDGPSPFLTVVAYGDRRGADAHPRSPCPIGVKSWRTRTTKCS